MIVANGIDALTLPSAMTAASSTRSRP